MSWLGWLARSAGWLLFGATLSSALAGLGSSLLVALINRSLNAEASELSALGLQFAALSVAVLVARWLSQAWFVELTQSTLARLRLRVSTHLARASQREIETHGPGRLMSVLTDDVNSVSELFVALPRLVMQGAVLIGCLAYLALLSRPAFGFALGMVVLGSAWHFYRVRRASDHLWRAREGEDELYTHFGALFSGAKELKLNARRRRDFVSKVLAESVDSVRQHRTRGLLVFVAAGSWGAFLFFVVIGGVIFVLGPWLEIPNEVRSGYALVFLYMMHPMEALLEAVPAVSRTAVALERIHEVGGSAELPLESPPPYDTPPCTPLQRAPLEHLGLSEVTHRYRKDHEDGVFQLGPLSLALRPGEVVFLIGGNGSGKTTLAKLLVGLYEPDTGHLLLNHGPVRAEAREAYRQNFAGVFSDFHLFDSLLGIDPERLDERARELLSALELEHKVRIEGGVFSTTELSLGQQKRLALLVAFLEDRPAYVFDEWAADQDPAYKEVFYRQVLPELKARNKAVFVVTHDDRYFHLADRCLVLEAGNLRAPEPSRTSRGNELTA
jgi:putative ATP-binding cassette transporter